MRNLNLGLLLFVLLVVLAACDVFVHKDPDTVVVDGQPPASNTTVIHDSAPAPAPDVNINVHNPPPAPAPATPPAPAPGGGG